MFAAAGLAPTDQAVGGSLIMVFRASRRRGSLAGGKFVPNYDELQCIVESLQSQGKVVVFTSGTFDLLHVGHLRCLRDAKSRGDFLILGLQSDRGVQRHKHPSLPIVSEKERAELLEAIDCVDYVTLYHEETAEKVLLKLKPNIYAMGTDYKPTTIPARDAVLSYGGRVLVAGDAKKHSSTDLMQRVKSIRRLPATTAATTRAGGKTKKSRPARATVGA